MNVRHRAPLWGVTRLAGKVTALLVVFAAVAVPLGVTTGFWALLNLDLPGQIPDHENPRIESRPSVVVDAAGNRIAEFRAFELTVPLEPEDVPTVLEDAVVAAEDRRFWEHNGVDPMSLIRAAIVNYESGEIEQGGSTITQQYVKNTYTQGERDISRKLREALIATRLEREMSKEEILFRYLDTVYFGDGAYGVGAAAESYFRKPVSELTISESALLAGAIAAPSRYGPRVNADVAEQRRLLVLDAMREEEMITEAEYQAARAERIWYAPFGEPPGPAPVVQPPPSPQQPTYPYFVDYVRRSLEANLGENLLYRGGLTIETTIDPRMQAEAEAAVAERLDGTAPPLEMSLVSVEPSTGFVRALVGGRDFQASQVNLALGGSTGMQPGSSFKPFVLASALEHGVEPEERYPAPSALSFPGCAGTCTISNYDGDDRGRITLRNATEQSVNTVYAQLVDEVGPGAVAELAHRVGVSRIDPAGEYGVSLALGSYEVSPLDMAAGYATFANHGVRRTATPIVRITDPEGRVLEDNSAPGGEQVVDPAVADTVTDVLSGVIASGTGTSADIGRPAAGKTGTAQDYRAAWFVGYTPQLSTAVWMGYSDAARPLVGIRGVGQVTGGSHPAQVWARYMRAAHANLEVLGFTPPGPLPDPDAAPAAPQAPAAPPPPPAPVPPSEGDRSYGNSVVADCGGPCVIQGPDLTP